MRVSVVLCTHVTERYDALAEAAESVLQQSHDDVELVLVSDGSDAVYERMERDYGDRDDVVVHCHDRNRGLLESRNTGAELASGDVVAFIDDDAVAADDWLEKLVAAYERRDAIAVGGRMTPRWVAGKPGFLPEEFYWLVGVTHRGFAGDTDEPCEVRNTNGSNISFRRDVFLDLGGFATDIGGRKGDKQLQGGETELCARMREAHGQGVWYVPDAEVEHKVFDYRTDPLWLVKRAFWQGYSKRGMEEFVPASTGEEKAFLGRLLGEYVPRRLAALARRPTAEEASQLAFLFIFLGAVVAGYGYGYVKW
jgi:glycosyltransferase involved in cell wall biosynthesis